MGLFQKVIDSFKNKSIETTEEIKIDEPKFIKDFSMENKQIKDLTNLVERLKDGHKKELINRDIFYLKQGLHGEKNVYYELKNSFLPIICIHDIRLQYEDYSAQLDFVVISSRFIAILETKKLNGNIKINSNGDFIRELKNGEKGMYSPVSQNRRHANILKYMLSKELKGKNIDIESLVVMANEKTIINMYKASNDIKESIIKYDGLNSKLRELYNSRRDNLSMDSINKITDLLLKYNTSIEYDYVNKYGLVKQDYINTYDYKTSEVSSKDNMNRNHHKNDENEIFENLRRYRNHQARILGYDYKVYHYVFPNSVIEQLIEYMPSTLEKLYNIKGLGKVKIERYGDDILKILSGENVEVEKGDNKSKKVHIENNISKNVSEEDNREKLVQELKKYRLEKSRKLNIKPYQIYSNDEMEALIINNPKNKEELMKVRGFGQVKTEKYGDDILRILLSYSKSY